MLALQFYFYLRSSPIFIYLSPLEYWTFVKQFSTYHPDIIFPRQLFQLPEPQWPPSGTDPMNYLEETLNSSESEINHVMKMIFNELKISYARGCPDFLSKVTDPIDFWNLLLESSNRAPPKTNPEEDASE